MSITKAEASALHRVLYGTYPEDSSVAAATQRVLKRFHVKLDVYLAVAHYGERPTFEQLSVWDAELSTDDLG